MLTGLKVRVYQQRIGARDFWRFYKQVINKYTAPIPLWSMGLKYLHQLRTELSVLVKIFAANSNINDEEVLLLHFNSRTDFELKSLGFSVKNIALIISKSDSSKATGPVGIPVILLKAFSGIISSAC